jgi:hypothetical protein
MTEAEFFQRLQELVVEAESGGRQRPVIIAGLQAMVDALKNAASA